VAAGGTGGFLTGAPDALEAAASGAGVAATLVLVLGSTVRLGSAEAAGSVGVTVGSTIR
jgi:hypothetical protein